MERFVGKVSVVTGSGAGIGAAITKELVKRGLIVVGLSKIIEKESSDWSKNFPGKFYTIQCDVSVEEEIKNAFHTIKTTIGPISILVNNAGITSHSYLKDLSGEEIDNVFGTNVKGLLMAAKEAINSMEESPIDGHIVVICSTAAYRIPPLEESMVYAGSKHAARAISEALRLISVQKKSNIKISIINPGLVKTNLVRVKPSLKPLLDSDQTSIYPEDIAKVCMAVLDTPPNVLISETTVMPIHSAL